MKNICRNSEYLAWRRTGGGKGALTIVFKYLALCHKRKSLDSLSLFFKVSEEIIMRNEWKLEGDRAIHFEYKFLKVRPTYDKNGCSERKKNICSLSAEHSGMS